MFEFFQSAWENLGTFPFNQLTLVVWLLILLALTFDFLNGLHDAANSIATIVSTRVLSPHWAVVWAAFFNFVAFVVFPLKVSETIRKTVEMGDPIIADFSSYLVASALLAACGWNLLTWYLGLPTSSSHALIGGLVGAALALTGSLDSLNWGEILWIVLFIVLAPMIGLFLGFAIALGVTWACHRTTPRRVDRIFRWGQFFSASFFSLGHGGNDAQKTMGVIFFLLLASQVDASRTAQRPGVVPTEVVLACHAAMGLGTLFGGWRIVKTMGQRIIKLRPVDGFCAETGAATVLAMTTLFKGIPISTTHTITGAIVGVGSLKRLSAVRWGVAGRVVWAWILTIPGSALMAAISVGLLRILF